MGQLGVAEGPGQKPASSAGVADELMRNYLKALEGGDLSEATRITRQAVQQAPGQPAVALMARHTELLAKAKVRTDQPQPGPVRRGARNDRVTVYNRTYNVADLVVSVPSFPDPARGADSTAAAAAKINVLNGERAVFSLPVDNVMPPTPLLVQAAGLRVGCGRSAVGGRAPAGAQPPA